MAMKKHPEYVIWLLAGHNLYREEIVMGIRLSGDISGVQEGVNVLLSSYPFAARAFQGEIVVSRLKPDAPDSFVIRRQIIRRFI